MRIFRGCAVEIDKIVQGRQKPSRIESSSSEKYAMAPRLIPLGIAHTTSHDYEFARSGIRLGIAVHWTVQLCRQHSRRGKGRHFHEGMPRAETWCWTPASIGTAR